MWCLVPINRQKTKFVGSDNDDVLIGGTGADTFKFAELGSTDRDTIADYEFAAGHQVDLSASSTPQVSTTPTSMATSAC